MTRRERGSLIAAGAILMLAVIPLVWAESIETVQPTPVLQPEKAEAQISMQRIEFGTTVPFLAGSTGCGLATSGSFGLPPGTCICENDCCIDNLCWSLRGWLVFCDPTPN